MTAEPVTAHMMTSGTLQPTNTIHAIGPMNLSFGVGLIQAYSAASAKWSATAAGRAGEGWRDKVGHQIPVRRLIGPRHEDFANGRYLVGRERSGLTGQHD